MSVDLTRALARGARAATIAAIGVVALAASAGPALAQRESGPFAGLFTGAPARDTSEWFDFHGAFGASYDQNLVDDPNSTSLKDPRLWQSGMSMGASGSLVYLRRTDKSETGFTTAGSARKYSVSRDFATAVDAGATHSRKLAPKLFFNTKANTHYSPFMTFGFPGGSVSDPAYNPVTSFGYAAISDPNGYLDGDVQLLSRFTKRSEFSVGMSARQWWFFDRPEANVGGWGGSMYLRHNITRPLSVRAGFGRDQVLYNYRGARPIPNDTIDFGVDYGDTLQLSRRTTLGFSTSTSAIHFLGETHFRLNGSASLTRGFKRTWTTSLNYNRGSEFLPLYPQPILNDSLYGMVGGMLNPRVRWSAAAGYTRATVGFDDARQEFDSGLIGWFSSSTTLGWSVTRFWGLSTQYRYYRYAAPTDTALLDFAPKLSRQAVTVALNLWVPIINETRSSEEPQP